MCLGLGLGAARGGSPHTTYAIRVPDIGVAPLKTSVSGSLFPLHTHPRSYARKRPRSDALYAHQLARPAKGPSASTREDGFRLGGADTGEGFEFDLSCVIEVEGDGRARDPERENDGEEV